MLNSVNRAVAHGLCVYGIEKLLYSTMRALKTTVKDPTTWHVFIQDFAASLNRSGLLNKTSAKVFTEQAYAFMTAKS
jgi:hypothetical protein